MNDDSKQQSAQTREEKLQHLKKEYQDVVRAAAQKRQKELNDEWEAKQNDELVAMFNKRIVHDGKEMTYWDAVKVEADKALRIEQNTYQDWRASMMGLLAIFSSIVDAGNHSLKKQWKPIVGQLYGAARKKLQEKLVSPLKDYLRGPYDLSPLIHNVSMGADNKLDFGLTRADRRTEMGEMNARFKVIVELWLAEHDYTPHKSEQGVYIKKNSEGQEERLTADVLNELKHSEENGLNEFLNRDTILKFDEAIEAVPVSAPSL